MRPGEAFVERTEMLVAGPAEGLAGLLDTDLPQLESHGLPLLWHWIYLLDRPRQADLGRDGHPRRGTIPAPPEEGRRRMWAGGRVTRHGPLVIGREATRRTQVISTTDKTGRTGRLTFVVVEHVFSQDGRVVVREEQNIVYRDAVAGAIGQLAPGPKTAELLPDDRPLDISPTLLLRFSALTYNAHRIHYDRIYARDVEGYPGLVTHGPLQALTMAEAARAAGAAGPLEMSYRLFAPLIDSEGLVARADIREGGWSTVVRDLAGRETARGVVSSLDGR